MAASPRSGQRTPLGAAGSSGLGGRTDLVSPGSTSERYRQLDRRLYSPLALTLAALAADAALAGRGRP